MDEAGAVSTYVSRCVSVPITASLTRCLTELWYNDAIFLTQKRSCVAGSGGESVDIALAEVQLL